METRTHLRPALPFEFDCAAPADKVGADQDGVGIGVEWGEKRTLRSP